MGAIRRAVAGLAVGVTLLGAVGCESAPTAPAAADPAVARPLLVEPSEADAAATLRTLRKLDDHPLYLMTYTGPAPRPGPRPAGTPRAAAAPAFACTVFLAAGAEPVLGRNFDWQHSPALLLYAKPRGGYASVSLVDTSYLGLHEDRDFADPAVRRKLLRAVTLPFDGMNEHGLAIGMAQVDDGVAEVRRDRTAVGSLGVIRLALDRARTVDEAIARFAAYNIDFTGGPPLHYLIADATGASAVVEFVAGRMRVVRRQAGVAWQAMENFHLTGADEATRLTYPRYSTVADRLTATQGRLDPPGAMRLLSEVAQGHTQWSVVYQLTTRHVTVVTGKRYAAAHPLPWPL